MQASLPQYLHQHQRDPVIAYIALGANLGDARAAMRAAIVAISSLPGVKLIAASSLYSTEPVESIGPDYINAVVKVSSTLPAYSLLRALQKLEHEAQRERPYRNAPRTLDLDVLLYGSAQIESDVLTVPHPRMWERAFVLLPLHEIAPELVSATALHSVARQRIELLASH
jgi:2-amino-4-hydroxy-6-hydroxymethyldihydropteridine diphosphokinase